MDLFNYVKRFFSSFKKNEIRERIRTVKHLLSSPVLQTVETLSTDDQYKEMSFVSNYGKKFIASWLTNIPSRARADRNQPYLSMLRPAVVNAIALLEQLDEYVSKQLDDVLLIEGMTYQKATVLRVIELLNFFGDYSIRQLTYLVASETDITAFGKVDGRPYPKDEEKFLEGSNQLAYFRMIELLSNDPKSVLQQILKIRDNIITQEDSIPTLGPSDDPLRLGFIPLVSDIIMWNGIRQVELDASRLDRAVKEERTIKARMQQYHNKLATGHGDARTESIIANYERELILTRNKIKDMTHKLQVRR